MPTAPAEPDGTVGKRIKQNGNISIWFMFYAFIILYSLKIILD
jgi:hypothetical protein